MDNRIALKIRSRLGEGIWWDDRRAAWFWVDIMKKEVHCMKDGEDRLLKTFDDFVGFCAPCEDGRLVVGCGRDLLLFDPDTLDTQVLQTVDEDETNNRFNDAKCTPDGRILAGTMNNILNEEDADDANTGRLYLLESGKKPVQLMDKLTFTAYPEGEVEYYYDYYIEEFEYYYSMYKVYYGYTSLDEFAIDYMGLQKGDDWKKILTESCQETVKSSVLVHAIAEVEGMEQITDEEFKAELDYLVEYYKQYNYTAEYIRQQMGDDAIKESALYAKVQEFIMDRITVKYE